MHTPRSNELSEMIRPYSNITLTFEPENQSELPAIHHLADTADDINLYFHSKGVTHTNSRPVRAWREYMNYFNLCLWRECVADLNIAGAVGVNFQPNPMPHYSGNFWWATKNHISSVKQKPMNRADCEWYIASVPGKYMSMHNSGINHYHEIYDNRKWVVNKQLFETR